MADKNLNSITFPGLSDKYRINQIASEYSSSSTYAVGDIVNHLGTTYRCTTAISTAEAWTAGHWTEVKVANEVTDLKSTLALVTSEIGYTITPTEASLYAENHYINSSGTNVEQSGFSIYGLIEMLPGMTIHVTARGYSNNVAVIATTTEEAITFVPVVVSTDDTVKEYEYTTSDRIYVVISSNKNTPPVYYITQESINERINDIINEARYPEIINVPNKYINQTGGVSSQNNFAYSNPIQVTKGEIVEFYARGWDNTVSMISICSQNGSNIIPKVISPDHETRKYQYVVEDDGYVIVSYDMREPHNLAICKTDSKKAIVEKIDNIEKGARYPQIEENANEYINVDGSIIQANNFAYSDPIQVNKGEVVDFYAKGWQNVSMISTCYQDGSNITSIASAPDNVTRHYKYVVEDDGYVIVSYDMRDVHVITVYKASSMVSIVNRIDSVENDDVADNLQINLLSAFDNITCIGDSLTYSQVYTGQNTSRQAYVPYPKALSRKTGANYYILARAGASAYDAWNEFNTQIISRTNNLTIIYLGTNLGLTDTIDTDCVGDDYENWSSTHTGSYGKAIAKSLDIGSRVVLVKCYSSSGNLETTNSVIEKFGQKFNVPVISNDYLSDNKYHTYPDGSGINSVHYNDFGYCMFADMIINKVSKLDSTDLKKIIPV